MIGAADPSAVTDRTTIPGPVTPAEGRPVVAGPSRTELTITSHPVAIDIADLAREAGIRRVHFLAWRDLADVEAGGSELHADRIAARWAEAGLEVTMRTSFAQGQTPEGHREGYRVIRRSGRYGVFPSAILNETFRRHGPVDAMVEIWNGVPFLSPIWFRGPKVIVLHHVHHAMWDQVLEPRLAKLGRLLEGRLAPPFYQRVPFLTPSWSSKDEMVNILGLPEANIRVSPPGIDPRFFTEGTVERSPHPLIVSVGRLMPPKRFDEMIRIADNVRREHPDLELVIVGDGYERENLEELIAELDAESWVRLAGRVSDEELIALYQRAWVVSSASTAEGWGMTLTEAAASGTPAVASRIAGHRDSVADGTSGLLADSSREMVEQLSAVIGDPDLRHRLSEGARKHAAAFTWDTCALAAFEQLAVDATHHPSVLGRAPRR